jgi:predicted nuclease with TOPRIM domain
VETDKVRLMLTKADKQFLFATFVTKEDLSNHSQKLTNTFATKDDMFTRLDEIVGELRALREEITILVYRQADHSDRIEKLEGDFKALKKPDPEVK